MGLSKNINVAFQAAFEDKCICLMVDAYRLALHEYHPSITNFNEDDITELLIYYINQSSKSEKYKIFSKTQDPIFEKDKEIEKGFASKQKVIDIAFSNFNSGKRIDYFLEAKKLKEKDSALKQRYIDTGIDNFVSMNYKNGSLIGYLLEGDLYETIQGTKGINSLLVKVNRPSEILQKRQSKLHDCYYESTHDATGVLKHFIFDFAKSIAL